MKKVLFILFNLAQTKGRFEVHDLGNYRLHVYYTNDALGDASYIIEGKDSLVTMEQPLFKDNVAEFDSYLSMKGFEQAFGDALTDMPTGKATEVAFGTTQTWAGVTFEFRNGATTDFPGASILIGGKAYYTHWTPAKAHVSNLQISSPAAIDAEIAEAENSLASGAECGGVQDRLSEKDEGAACGQRNGRGFHGCHETGMARTSRRSRIGRFGQGTLQIMHTE